VSPLRFLLAGGGTSGHITPALAIADQIRRDHPDAEIRFCGTARGLESDIVPRAGYPFTAIRARGLPTRPSPAMIKALADFLAGRRQCIRLLKDFRPNAVIGTGGYVCSPVVSAAARLKIPVLLHEQNAFPGRSNRLMAKSSQAVCISFPGTEQRFPPGTATLLTGNPVRASFFGRDRAADRQTLALAAGTPLILAVGGSLGARTLNQAILGLAIERAFPDADGLARPRVIVSAGKQHVAAMTAAAAGKDWLEVREYIHDMDRFMSAADLIICRAGAMTCAELAALGRPSILVPYPFAAGDHQTFNARALADAGAAILCPDAEMTPDWLADSLRDLFCQPGRLAAMGCAAAGLARPDAAAAICRRLYEVML
jgi:UDP-N-acetylglucosamine--N-acetylmuramyl-(pentapeptide) pyrophosphoryl-undecaprenol N-acetylglucosamine transferase